ncbi:MAG: N-6 DNA methylase [Planctomycetes bacterium]|nr:N-6 DNA methylase [Planctomycetota bacterium]
MSETIFAKYLGKLEAKLKSGDSTEHTHRPAFQNLLEELHPDIEVTNEPKQIQCGAPDFVIRKSVSKSELIDKKDDNNKEKTLFGDIARSKKKRRKPKTEKLKSNDDNKVMLIAGYIEAKDIGKSLDDALKTDQLTRYLRDLPNLILTNYIEFRWFQNGELKRSESLGIYNEKKQTIRFNLENKSKVAKLIEDFLSIDVEPIVSSKDLASQLAKRTHVIRDIVIKSFKINEASQTLIDLRTALAEVLIPDINDENKTGEFADMFAQTLTYGLFAAKVNHKSNEPFERHRAAEEIPKTNPFLRKLFSIITGEDFEFEPYYPFVDEIVQLLDNTNIEEILKDFGKATRQEDPMIHFYETFLKVYDPKLREQRGVYYTPEPVVSYIVRSVDYILREKFGLIDGLADETTVRYEVKDKSQKKNNKKNKTEIISKEVPKVLILDPACGTGTFLYEVIRTIREKFVSENNIGKWKSFVKEQLIKRIFGFELLMSPYAVAHFKLALLLSAQDKPENQRKDWCYDIDEDKHSEENRLRVFLTNTLEGFDEDKEQKLFGSWNIIPEEAKAANEVKTELPIMVVLGNPPYSANSANRGKWIEDLIRTSYYPKDEIKEHNPKLLLDDYVKFIRWSQQRIEITGSGIHAFITNHSYLDTPTFRGMRQKLMQTFDEIYILNLHGNSRKKEKCPDGSKDENVFDIQQGVAIGIFIKYPIQKKQNKKAVIKYADLWGKRELKENKILVSGKYHYLNNHDISKTDWEVIKPITPFYLLIPQDVKLYKEYEKLWKINDIMPLSSTGIKTHRDHFVIDFDKKALKSRIEIFRDLETKNDDILKRFSLSNKKDWNLDNKRKSLAKDEDWETYFNKCLCRPFDIRWIFNHRDVVDRARTDIMQHMLNQRNIGILTNRTVNNDFKHVFSTRRISGDCSVSSLSKERTYLFPLYLLLPKNKESKQEFFEKNETQWEADKDGKIPNLNPEFVNEFAEKLGLKFKSSGKGDLKKTFNPEVVFHYIYAVFHSPTYRKHYAEFLRIDFPRVPLTSDKVLFTKLVQLGADLVSFHLLEHDYPHSTYTKNDENSPINPPLASKTITFPVAGENSIDKPFPKYQEIKCEQFLAQNKNAEIKFGVYVNKEQYFANVSQIAWEFEIGGYKPAQKWLKERQKHNRKLTNADLTHYSQMIIALTETHKLMQSIDDILTFPLN